MAIINKQTRPPEPTYIRGDDKVFEKIRGGEIPAIPNIPPLRVPKLVIPPQYDPKRYLKISETRSTATQRSAETRFGVPLSPAQNFLLGHITKAVDEVMIRGGDRGPYVTGAIPHLTQVLS